VARFLSLFKKPLAMKNKNENVNRKSTDPDQNKKDKKSDKPKSSLPRSGYPVLGENAEDYLREEANIEDLPDENDEAEYDKEIAHMKKKSNSNKDQHK
jgi:hypothetical protein